MLLRGVLKDEDHARRQHLVRELVRRQEITQRLIDRQVFHLHRCLAADALLSGILEVPIVRNRDAGGGGQRVEDVADRRVRDGEGNRLPRRRVQDWHGRGGASPVLHFLERPRAGGFDAVPDGPIDRGDLRFGQPVAGIVFRGELVFAARRLELVLRLEFARFLEVRPGGRLHRPLQCDLVVGVVRLGLGGPAVEGDGLIEIASLRRGVALTHGLPGSASGGNERHHEQNA